jgi:sarcosine oxidase subunit alpha
MGHARTPLHHWHAAHGARFAERDGWHVVAAYSGVAQEAEAARAGLSLADVSAFAKISLRGPGVADLVRSLSPDGAAVSPRGVAPILAGPALACRLTEDHLLVLGSEPSRTVLDQRLAALREGRSVVQTDVTSAYAGFWAIGPGLDELLGRLTQMDLRPRSFPENCCAETALAGVEALLVRCAGLPLPAMRIYVPWDLGEYVWERVMEAGRPGNMTPVGLEGLSLLLHPG